MANVEFWDSGVKGPTTLANGAGDTLRTINETFASHPWDIAFIGGDPVPGLCEVLDGLTEIGIDNKNPDGKDGSSLTVKGYRPGPFIIACTVWTEEQWGHLQALIDKFWRRPTKRTKVDKVAVSVAHPALDLYGINSGALIGCTFPKDGRFEGSKVIQFKFEENVPPKGPRVTKTASDPKVVKKLRQDASEPKNGAPLPPSSNRKNLGPGGPRPAP